MKLLGLVGTENVCHLGPVPARFLGGRGGRTQPMWRDLAGSPTWTSRASKADGFARQTAIQAFAAFSTWASQRIGDP